MHFSRFLSGQLSMQHLDFRFRQLLVASLDSLLMQPELSVEKQRETFHIVETREEKIL